MLCLLCARVCGLWLTVSARDVWCRIYFSIKGDQITGVQANLLRERGLTLAVVGQET